MIAEENHAESMILSLRPGLMLRAMAIIVLLLVIFYIIGRYLYLVHGHDMALGFVPAFDMNGEGNIPALYSTLQLLLAAFLAAAIASASHASRDRFRWHWSGMSAILLYMAVDEAAQLHEKLIYPMREALSASGLFYFAWVIPYGVLIIVLVFAYLRFLFGIRRRTALLFVAAGTLFVSGALGVELFEGAHVEKFGRDNFGFVAFVAIEESAELIAIIILLYALFDHIKTIGDEVRIRLLQSS